MVGVTVIVWVIVVSLGGSTGREGSSGRVVLCRVVVIPIGVIFFVPIIFIIFIYFLDSPASLPVDGGFTSAFREQFHIK